MISAVVVAGGTGERSGLPEGKQLAQAQGLPVLAHALLAFEHCPAIDEIVLVTHPDRVDQYRREAVEATGLRKVVGVAPGGGTRQESVHAGLRALSPASVTVAVHDGARPLVTPSLVSAVVAELGAHPEADGVVVGHPSYDTMKVVAPDGVVVDTPDRSTLWAVQTPQVFRTVRLVEAYEAARAAGFVGTDDASVVEWYGGAVRVMAGPRDNVKVTVAEDLAYVRAVLAARKGAS